MFSARLFWSRRGEVACDRHRPEPFSRTWLLQRWAPIPIDVPGIVRYQCQHCLDSPIRHPQRTVGSRRTDPLVLSVEPNDGRRARRARQLRSQGFIVVNAADEERAISLARDVPPNLLVVGTNGPPAPGDTLCARLKKEPLFAGVPTVLVGSTLDDVSVVADACLLDETGMRLGHVLMALLSLEDRG